MAKYPKVAALPRFAATYQLAKIQKDAVRSSALASLTQIRLETTSGGHGEHGDGDLPLSMQYATEVKRYAGNTPEYKRWSSVMAAQNDRGVMVELLKIKALDLTLQERQYNVGAWKRNWQARCCQPQVGSGPQGAGLGRGCSASERCE